MVPLVVYLNVLPSLFKLFQYIYVFYQVGHCDFNKINVYLQELASHSPFGLNLTDETAFVCPANVNFNV